MNLEEKNKNLEGCLNQTNRMLNSLISRIKDLEDLTKNDYFGINKRLNKLENPQKKWWQKIL